mmetsp:Transcript_8772/g.16264  ORF Transcript_8772/g.16264 Transcript_8772/m.16264 type:complete len:227 (+) Transcript_8772:3240-3920(+)
MGVLIEIVGSHNTDIPLPRQVCYSLIHLSEIDHVLCQVIAHGNRVHDLHGIHSCNRASNRVSHVVHPGLDGGQVAVNQAIVDVRKFVQRDASQLEVLPRRDVAAAARSRVFNDLRERPHLLRGDDAVRKLQSHHELSVLLLSSVKEAKPLQPDVDVRPVLLLIELLKRRLHPLHQGLHRTLVQQHRILLQLRLLEVVEFLLSVLHLDEPILLVAPLDSAVLVNVLV